MTDQRYSTHEDPLWPVHPVVSTVAAMWLDVYLSDRIRPMGLLVGEQPGKDSNPRLPLWPWPPRSSGGRLHQMSGMPMLAYLHALARVNLRKEHSSARWGIHGTRHRARFLCTKMPDGTRIVACGAKARDAFGCPDWWSPVELSAGNLAVVTAVAVPHPSGRCLEYNDPANREKTGRWIRWAARVGVVPRDRDPR